MIEHLLPIKQLIQFSSSLLIPINIIPKIGCLLYPFTKIVLLVNLPLFLPTLFNFSPLNHTAIKELFIFLLTTNPTTFPAFRS